MCKRDNGRQALVLVNNWGIEYTKKWNLLQKYKLQIIDYKSMKYKNCKKIYINKLTEKDKKLL